MVRPKDPLDQESPWVSQDGSVTIPSHQVAAEMQEIGSELAILQLSKFLNWHSFEKLALNAEITFQREPLMTMKHSLSCIAKNCIPITTIC